MNTIGASELVMNDDGSIFHLHLHPEQVAKKIILVGDPERSNFISGYFSKVETTVQNREFITHTGYFNNERVSVISTGIGTDNIDIVVNEVDALFNIDLSTRQIKDSKTSLQLVRLGTTGAMQPDIDVDSFLVTETSVGFDGLLNFYAGKKDVCDKEMEESFMQFTHWNHNLATPYFVHADPELMKRFSEQNKTGITISAPGFYGPQGRILRLALADEKLNEKISNFEYKNKKIANFEMESSAIYGLSKLLGHQALTVCAVIANRVTKKFSPNYKPTIKRLVEYALGTITDQV
ncbi:MAG TPA: nucleoside phosphorylase [Bacteroidales bacterium]|nr:nucleoside phosphorylase [Bacteroidales bacterium]